MAAEQFQRCDRASRVARDASTQSATISFPDWHRKPFCRRRSAIKDKHSTRPRSQSRTWTSEANTYLDECDHQHRRWHGSESLDNFIIVIIVVIFFLVVFVVVVVRGNFFWSSWRLERATLPAQIGSRETLPVGSAFCPDTAYASNSTLLEPYAAGSASPSATAESWKTKS